MARPLKYSSLEALQADIDAYFRDCSKSGRPLSITGLALALDTSRQTLMNYEEKPEYFDAVKRAKLQIENFYEEKLTTGQPAGTIFALKNFDWSDRQDMNLGGQKDNPLIIKNASELTDEQLAIIATGGCKGASGEERD